MIQPPGHHLAELNVGRLLAPTDDCSRHLRTPGESCGAFGGKYLKEARLWQTHGCAQVAAE